MTCRNQADISDLAELLARSRPARVQAPEHRRRLEAALRERAARDAETWRMTTYALALAAASLWFVFSTAFFSSASPPPIHREIDWESALSALGIETALPSNQSSSNRPPSSPAISSQPLDWVWSEFSSGISQTP